ncbi:MAG TPA: hypothetical protein VLA46_10890 [Saprospiraceae bacterium]|nr:hypothetical protein [Saprospiraceae bacterium]
MKIFLFFILLVPGIMVGQSKSFAWQDFSFGSPALHAKMPGQLIKQQTKLPPKAQEQVSGYEAHYLKDDHNGVVITVMYALYASVVADAKGAIDGTVGQWEATGTKVAILSTTDTKISGQKAIAQRGKLIIGGQEHDYMDVVIVNGARLWQVIVMTRASDASLKAVMQKITDSITF